MTTKIRARERESILLSLRSGVTPKVGIEHIQVGRFNEIKALVKDIDRIADGGAAFRLVIGDYGAGKTFFLGVLRSIALEKDLVTMHADLSPDRRLYSGVGASRNLYAELIQNMSTRNRPEGNSLVSIVERFITLAIEEADQKSLKVADVIQKRLNVFSELVLGYEFIAVIKAYWRGYTNNNEATKEKAIRWLRAGYAIRQDAIEDLDVRAIINDHTYYDALKLMGLFVRMIGYKGLLINLDELINVYRLSVVSRKHSYEQILRILNDCLQGRAEYIGFFLGGTNEFLVDGDKGVYSYKALESRLSANIFASGAGVVDYTSTVIKLDNLSPEELLILLKNLRNVYACGNRHDYLIDDDGLESFLHHCHEKIGASYFKTPRNTIKAFIDLLAVLEQNPKILWTDLIQKIAIHRDTGE
jgi:hypothetical protein